MAAIDNIKAQLRSLGIDDEVIKDIMMSVEPDQITGRIGIDSLMKYIFESKNPHLNRALQNGAKLVEQQRRESSADWSSIDLSVLPVQEDVTWWLGSTTLSDGGTAKEPARFMLECMTYGNKIDAPRLVDKYKSLPTAEELLQFIRRCIAKPLPGLEPCLPGILVIQRDFQPYSASLGTVLDTLPSGFKWAFESQAASSRSSSIFSYEVPLKSALKSKGRGNELFRQGDRKGSIAAYSDAIDCLMNAFRSDPNSAKNRDAEKLLAVCSANRAAALLLPDDESEVDSDLHGAWRDGQVAIRVDPSYAKGYVRVATAHQRLGHHMKAQEIIASALRRPELQDEVGLVDQLIQLQTSGKGLPTDEKEFVAWKELILVQDKHTAKLMEGVGGLWSRRMEEHLKNLRMGGLQNSTG